MIQPRRGFTERWQRTRVHGFTLLEVMVAFGLLAFGILGVTATQLAALNSSQGSRANTEGMHLARQQMEIFRSMTSSAVIALGTGNDPANPIDPDPGDATAASYIRSWTITPDSPEVGVISLTVQVSWVDSVGFNRSAAIQGLKADL